MSDSLVTALVAVLTGLIGLAAIAVLVSPNAKTGSVLTSGGNAFSTTLRAAVSPVTGGGGLSMPTLGSGIG